MNGNAEAGAGSASGYDLETVPGFTTSGNFTVVQYGAPGFPTLTAPGPADRGLNFFAGGPNNASSSASQVISLTSDAAAIDAGAVGFDLSAYLGGYASQNDNAVLTATFEDSSGTSLGLATLGPVLSVDRNGSTGLLFQDTTGIVPTATRQIGLTLQMTRMQGAYNDGYADNLSLVLTNHAVPAVPEMGSWVLLCVGLLPLAFIVRRIRAACP